MHRGDALVVVVGATVLVGAGVSTMVLGPAGPVSVVISLGIVVVGSYVLGAFEESREKERRKFQQNLSHTNRRIYRD
jgi:hypothetical protein